MAVGKATALNARRRTMHRRLNRLAALGLLLLLASCQRLTAPLGVATSASPTASHRSEGDLTADEVRDYLDGKTLEVGDGAAPITMHKAAIKAIAFGGGYSGNGEPWHSEITFIYDSGMGSYAVIADIEHRAVEDHQAFFGFKVKRIAKQ
jgi:hypothetical protein